MDSSSNSRNKKSFDFKSCLKGGAVDNKMTDKKIEEIGTLIYVCTRVLTIMIEYVRQ